MARDEKISNWKGGTLRIYAGPEHKFVVRAEVEPVGDGFGLVLPAWIELATLNVRLDFEVRRGRLALVAITSLPDAPGLSQTLVRNSEIWDGVKDFAYVKVVRLELDSRRHVIGVLRIGPRHPGDMRDWQAAVEDSARELGDALPRVGRPKLTDAVLERVAEVHREAELGRRSTAREVADEFGLTLDAAKKRIKKARDRGFLPHNRREK